MTVIAWDCANDAYRKHAYERMAMEIARLRRLIGTVGKETIYNEMIDMPRELTDEQADAAMRATAVHLDIKGSQLTVNREKMKARYRALVRYIENEPHNNSKG